MAELKVIRSDHPQLKEFRAAAAETMAREPLVQPIKRIAAVGAVYDPQEGFSRRDLFLLAYTFRYCQEKGISISPDFEIVPLDLRGGHDFLDPSLVLHADAVISCLITRPDVKAVWADGREVDPALLEMLQRREPSLRTSPFHSETAWREAALRCGARLVTAFSHLSEINGNDFIGSDYVMSRPLGVRAPFDTYSSKVDKYRMDILFRRDWKEGLMRAGIGS